MHDKHTKIVCTIGPASQALETLVTFGETGMDVARLNFSHGSHAEHAHMFRQLVRAGERLGQPFGVLQDLQGPRIRVGVLSSDGVRLVAGRRAVFSTAKKSEVGDIPVTLPTLHRDVHHKDRILFDDGLLEVEVQRIDGHRIFTEVVRGGVLLPHKGINLPGTTLRIPALSVKDRDDARFGVRLGVDFVALSFVRSPQDILGLRRLLNAQGARGTATRIIAKIEKREAVERFEEIVPHCDGVMIARGDLGVEVSSDHVPVIQKQLTAACRERAIPVIVATQMFDSMQRQPHPTRAEVSDVANAVAEHVDAVMLSSETAVGAFPVEAVRIIAQTIRTMEESRFDDVRAIELSARPALHQVIGASIRLLDDAMGNPSILVVTASGKTAREISAMRPDTSIFAYAFDRHVTRVMRLMWGVVPSFASHKASADQQLFHALRELRARKAIKAGDAVIAVSGSNTFPRTFSNRIEIVEV